ncbi:MAG TPA: hypothetical protein VIM73_08120, partial [Polyangiaceae bacterium]
MALSWGDLSVRRERPGVRPALALEEQRLVSRFLLELRRGLESRDPPMLALVEELAAMISTDGGRLFSAGNALGFSNPFVQELPGSLEQALQSGRLRLTLHRRDQLIPRDSDPLPDLPPIKPSRESKDTFFEVRLVDETGQALSGLEVEIAMEGDAQTVSTNAAGVALLEGIETSNPNATVSVPDPEPLEKLLEARWTKPRPGTRRSEGNTTELQFTGAAIAPIPLKAAAPNTVVLTPPLGELFAQLFDKTGRVPHADREYRIDGPQPFSGRTDDRGRLRHLQVFPGEYRLTLTVEIERAGEKHVDTYESPLLVLTPGSPPEVRLNGAVPFSVLVHLQFFFNTSKTFLLPNALPGLSKLRELYLRNDPSELLVV